MPRTSARALAAALLLSTAVRGEGAPRATIEDDYTRALDEARRRSVPILVDVWAPW